MGGLSTTKDIWFLFAPKWSNTEFPCFSILTKKMSLLLSNLYLHPDIETLETMMQLEMQVGGSQTNSEQHREHCYLVPVQQIDAKQIMLIKTLYLRLFASWCLYFLLILIRKQKTKIVKILKKYSHATKLVLFQNQLLLFWLMALLFFIFLFCSEFWKHQSVTKLCAVHMWQQHFFCVKSKEYYIIS